METVGYVNPKAHLAWFYVVTLQMRGMRTPITKSGVAEVSESATSQYEVFEAIKEHAGFSDVDVILYMQFGKNLLEKNHG